MGGGAGGVIYLTIGEPRGDGLGDDKEIDIRVGLRGKSIASARVRVYETPTYESEEPRPNHILWGVLKVPRNDEWHS